VKWLKRAAVLGHFNAGFQLSFLLPQDPFEAFRIMQRDAERGDVWAQIVVGRMLAGVSAPGLVQAFTWLSLAQAHGGLTQVSADSVKESLNEIASRMTPNQIAEAQRLVEEWEPQPGPTWPDGCRPWTETHDVGSNLLAEPLRC
jgi:hypothetical protein